MKTVACVLVALLVATAVRAQEPQPRAWPNQWFGLMSRNSTNNESGRAGPWETHMKWYNWDLRALRDDCQRDQVSSTFILIGKNIAADGWLYNTQAQDCVSIFVPVGPVTPTWMLGATYLGRAEVLQTQVNAWVKEDHFYYESLIEPRLVQQRLPIDNKGDSVWESFTHFIPQNVSSNVFDRPAFCANAPRFTLETLRNHRHFELYSCFQ